MLKKKKDQKQKQPKNKRGGAYSQPESEKKKKTKSETKSETNFFFCVLGRFDSCSKSFQKRKKSAGNATCNPRKQRKQKWTHIKSKEYRRESKA